MKNDVQEDKQTDYLIETSKRIEAILRGAAAAQVIELGDIVKRVFNLWGTKAEFTGTLERADYIIGGVKDGMRQIAQAMLRADNCELRKMGISPNLLHIGSGEYAHMNCMALVERDNVQLAVPHSLMSRDECVAEVERFEGYSEPDKAQLAAMRYYVMKRWPEQAARVQGNGRGK